MEPHTLKMALAETPTMNQTLTQQKIK